jgi:mRNA interferase HigB
VVVIGEAVAQQFAKKYSGFRKPWRRFIDIVHAAFWNNLAEVKTTFPSADYVNGQFIFNIGGNNYRLLAEIDFATKEFFIVQVMTHAEYDRLRL